MLSQFITVISFVAFCKKFLDNTTGEQLATHTIRLFKLFGPDVIITGLYWLDPSLFADLIVVTTGGTQFFKVLFVCVCFLLLWLFVISMCVILLLLCIAAESKWVYCVIEVAEDLSLQANPSLVAGL